VEGRRNSRDKKTTPFIQNYKTPKQQKTSFQESFQVNLNFKHYEKALCNVKRGKGRGWFFYIERKIGHRLKFKICFLEVSSSYLTPYTLHPMAT
jgi:hypothetical protein